MLEGCVRPTAERWGLAAIAVGVAFWLVAPAIMDLSYDPNAYVAEGHGWMREHRLVLAWGDVLTFAPEPEGPSHHYPPAYPIYLGLFFSAFGYGLAQAKVASVVMGLLMLAVVYVTTRDLFGRTAAAVVTGIVALDPLISWVVGQGLSESLALLLFTLTMWAILRSLRDERFIVLAGLFAALAYLSRASMGAFFLLAGGAGLAWRLWHRGVRRTATSPWYALGIAIFTLIVGAWAWRNLALFDWPNWETSVGSRGLLRWVRGHPRDFALGLAVKMPLMLLALLPLPLVLSPQARRSLWRIREEGTSALWLSVALVAVLGAFFAAAYWSMGPSRYETLRFDNMRYALVGIVPLAWALARESDWSDRATRHRWAALAVLFVVGTALLVSYPARYLPAEAARSLDPALRPGDHVAVASMGKYPFYAYVHDPTSIVVYTDGNAPDIKPEFVMQTWSGGREGYVPVLEARERHPWWPAEDDVIEVLARSDVAQARGLAALAAPHAGW